MTTHTIRLEDQGVARPTITPYRLTTGKDLRCEHEVLRNGIVRQCRREPSMVVDGRRLCTIHGRLVKDRV